MTGDDMHTLTVSDVVIAVEPLSRELFDETLPLARKSWAENTIAKAETCAWYGERDFDVDPDFEQYKALAAVGALVVMTMRDAEVLVGYVTGTCWRGMHHRHFVVAQSDSFYVEPAFRGYAMRLVRAYEREMIKRGAVALNSLTHTNGPLYKLLLARGYVPDETMLEKRVVRKVPLCA
jgi:GNAT superfamily N-acetyltransferase